MPDSLVFGLLGEFEGGMNERVGRMIARDDLWARVIELALHSDPRVAFRASWALEWAYFDDRKALLPHIDRFVEVFLVATNPSVHRHYSKILYDIQYRRMVEFDDIRLARIAEKCFDLLIDPATRTAVKVWCMEILYDAAPRLDWVEEALRETLEGIMTSDPSRGLANRAAKMLRRMDGR